MTIMQAGTVAVIFCSLRTGEDETGYAAAAQAMIELASRQPGFLHMDSVGDANKAGITISYWQDEESAADWRDHPEHKVIRDQGRGRWYSAYDLHVTRVERSYDWQKGRAIETA